MLFCQIGNKAVTSSKVVPVSVSHDKQLNQLSGLLVSDKVFLGKLLQVRQNLFHSETYMFHGIL